MIEVGVVDLSAESRRRLGALLEKWSWDTTDSVLASFPKLSINLLSPEEIKFHGGIEVCFVGPELINCDAAYIATLRKALPHQILICVLDSRTYSFGMIEQLGRLDVDDVLVDSASRDEFFRRLLLLTRKVTQKKSGQIVLVDAVKGGVGATFVAAGIAESYLNQGKRVCLVDTDVVTQDATRFLGCRPFVNEPLKLLLDQQRVVTSETVKECVFQVWDEETKLCCIPPAAASDQGTFSNPSVVRSFLSVLDTLRGLFDYVIVDAAPLIASARQTLAQVSSRVCLVVDRDPAGAYAHRHALNILSGCCRSDTELLVVINDTKRGGLSNRNLLDDVLVAKDRSLTTVVMPHQVRAGRWACSGATPAQFLPSVFSSLTLKENERVSKNSMAEGVSGILTTIKNLILRPHPHTLVDRVEKIHRNSTTLRVHEQSTLLTGLPEDPEVRDLISKPTLAGL
jgi:Mrp family chromosome partitioning ATPase